MRFSTALTIAGFLLGLTACGAVDRASPPASAEDGPRVSVTLLQNRSDPPVGRLQLRVTNESRSELRIRTATLESDALTGPAVWRKGTTLQPGATRDLPVVFPGASCAEEASQTVVRIEAETPAGATTLEVIPADPSSRMPQLTGADCFAREVGEVARVILAGLHTDDDPAVPAELELRVESAGGDGTLRITAMESTVLFHALDAGGAPSNSVPLHLELRPGQPDSVARVPIMPNRCDPHALAEDKVGTLFVFSAELEDGRTGTLALPASPELRADLYGYFTRTCNL